MSPRENTCWKVCIVIIWSKLLMFLFLNSATLSGNYLMVRGTEVWRTWRTIWSVTGQSLPSSPHGCSREAGQSPCPLLHLSPFPSQQNWSLTACNSCRNFQFQEMVIFLNHLTWKISGTNSYPFLILFQLSLCFIPPDMQQPEINLLHLCALEQPV